MILPITEYAPQLEALQRICASDHAGVWLCGGTVRDLILGRSPDDLDLVTDGDAMALGRAWAESIGGRMVALKPEADTCRVVLSSGDYVDLAGLRRSTLQADLAARDLTINAMALSLSDLLHSDSPLDHVIDPLGGRRDLADGILRPAGGGVLRDDPVRVLRVFRFMASTGFKLAAGFAPRLQATAPRLADAPAERLGQEWLKLMAGIHAYEAIRGLDQVGALGVLIPELEAGRGMVQNPYHHLDVFEHSLECLKQAMAIASTPEAYYGSQGHEISAYLIKGRNRALLMSAALLHDLGKPPTCREKEPGFNSFHYHESAGAKLAKACCRALGLSVVDAGRVADLVLAHMRPFGLLGAESKGILSPKAMRRFIVAAGDDLPAWFLLAMADTIAGKGPERPEDTESRLADLYTAVARMRDEELAARMQAPPLLNGNEVMQALAIGSSPLLGRILAELRGRQLDGVISSRDEALASLPEIYAALVDSTQAD